ASGSEFRMSAVPALNRVAFQSARDVLDLHGDEWQSVSNRLGGGSDYTVFLNYLGVPVADLSFTGPYGVYHSIYDTHNWVATIGDPGFRYHAALVKVWGLAALRLADADVLPLDYAPYADRIAEFAAEV